MSSILIKGMTMPENCIKCPLQFGGWCYASPPEIDERVAPTVDEAWEQGKPDWCPLVELPEKHGRLIDDRIAQQSIGDHMTGLSGRDGRSDWQRVHDGLADTPTVIEAEGEE